MTNDPYLQVIKAYASNSSWIIGFLMDIFGAVLMLLALSQAPVSSMKLTLCQPIELNNTCSYVKADFFFFKYRYQSFNPYLAADLLFFQYFLIFIFRR